MPKLLESKKFIEFFELDTKNETTSLSNEGADKWLMSKMFELDESLRKWAEVHYPNAPTVDHCCFAGLIAYFATGVYGGYGTENNQKERFAEHKAYEFYNHMQNRLSPEDMTVAMIYFVASHILQKPPLEVEVQDKIKEAAKLLEDSKKSFKSQQVAAARKILQGILFLVK